MHDTIRSLAKCRWQLLYFHRTASRKAGHVNPALRAEECNDYGFIRCRLIYAPPIVASNQRAPRH